MHAHRPEDHCQPVCRRWSQQGFTLLELLVVLVIVGLVSAVAVPQMSTLAERVEFALNRETVERALSRMPYEAFKRREDFILGEPLKQELGEAGPAAFQMNQSDTGHAVSVEGPILLTQAPIDLPSGWRFETQRPIIYRATGLCSGGELNIRVGDMVFPYNLKAPSCQPLPK